MRLKWTNIELAERIENRGRRGGEAQERMGIEKWLSSCSWYCSLENID